MSMMTALNANDGDDRSYLEIVDAIRISSSNPSSDLRELWRRLIFNVLISNSDDHLRNHAFLRSAEGWRLSPAYDMNPSPADVNARVHALAINEVDHQASFDLAFDTHEYYGLKRDEAAAIASAVGAAVSEWRAVAGRAGLTRNEMDRMASAFDHGDILRAAAVTAAGAVEKARERKKGTKPISVAPEKAKPAAKKRNTPRKKTAPLPDTGT